MIANPIKVNGRFSVLRELGLDARDEAVSSTKGDALQGSQLWNDQVISVIEEGGGAIGVKNHLRTAGRP